MYEVNQSHLNGCLSLFVSGEKMRSLKTSITFQSALRELARQKRCTLAKRLKDAFSDTFLKSDTNAHQGMIHYAKELQLRVRREKMRNGSHMLTVCDHEVHANTPDWTSTALYVRFLYRCNIHFESIGIGFHIMIMWCDYSSRVVQECPF